MTVAERDIRDLCTEAVFERGVTYREEGRIHQLTRTGETVTALVQGTRRYNVTVDLSAPDFGPTCSCPYAGPGVCKHVVAVLLALTDDLPADVGKQSDALLEAIPHDQLRDFVRDELVRNPSLRERFFARFGESPAESVDDYRTEIDQLFEQHTRDSPTIVFGIDFSRFTDLAEQYRKRGDYRSATTIFRALVTSIDEHMHLVDGAYDHYARTFSTALDAYVDCVKNADLGSGELQDQVEFLSERATSGTDYFQPEYERALDNLRGEL
ncbi:SWIM zinc finger family protein [Halorussus gelatinilyticus]|uniref:SWIM zinc finger family protein n=1 Tax=Halorussus gelatinilyticus TaxID=2937524 RepID=A0A8U0ILY4_9EURY|nr:SWIM zinc finger family protein [Halorussus gelatinilyticus]UPW01372.1 SWIM zinc finger family protein [Halorussus gelatinilyticus]